MSEYPVIETRQLSKKFHIGTRERLTLFSALRYRLSGEYPTGDLWALRDITFSVKPGEMIAVIGPNGAGKTTLLKILAGIMSHTSGTFDVRGGVSCIFELGLGFNPRFTALENIFAYGALHGLRRREVEKLLPEIADFSEMGEFMGAKLGDFSSGMRARLAFATVLQTMQNIVMIDEVLTVGDASFQQKCQRAFERMLHEGKTILFISHGLGGVKRLCTNALYINKGVQKGFGPVEEVTAQYAADVEAKMGRLPSRTIEDAREA
jgi:ABC-type polysaccharide/polyol phosphate transport system ATPase subunit